MKNFLILLSITVFLILIIGVVMIFSPKKDPKKPQQTTAEQTTMQAVETTVATTTAPVTETTPTTTMDPEKEFKKWLSHSMYEGGYDDLAVKALSGKELIAIYEEIQKGLDEATQADIDGHPNVADSIEKETFKNVAEKHNISEDIAFDVYSYMLYNEKDVRSHLREMESKKK